MKEKDDFFNMFLQKKSIYEAEKAAITGSPLWTEGVGESISEAFCSYRHS